MAIKNPHDLFVYDLAATYYSERTMLKGMNDMLKRAHKIQQRLRGTEDRRTREIARLMESVRK